MCVLERKRERERERERDRERQRDRDQSHNFHTVVYVASSSPVHDARI